MVRSSFQRVCWYFNERLPIRILKITPMIKCLVSEMLHNTKLVNVSVIYRSPSKSSQEFSQFEMLFSQLLNDIISKKPFFSIILGDFNARSKFWWNLDKQSKECDSTFLISSASGRSTDKFRDTYYWKQHVMYWFDLYSTT